MQKLILIIPLILLSISKVNSECISFKTFLTREIKDSGFHRKLSWLIEISRPDSETLTEENCRFLIKQKIPRGAYVNPDQLAERKRAVNLTTFIRGRVDVELVEYEATPHTVYVFVDTASYKDVKVTIPFHLRYQRAQIEGEYAKVVFPKTRLLVKCAQIEKFCEKQLLLAPCDSTGQKNCRWFNLTYGALHSDDEVPVPIGDLDDYPLVAISTLSIGCFGCIYILSLLSKISKTPDNK